MRRGAIKKIEDYGEYIREIPKNNILFWHILLDSQNQFLDYNASKYFNKVIIKDNML